MVLEYIGGINIIKQRSLPPFVERNLVSYWADHVKVKTKFY